MKINWYPGHMKKNREIVVDLLKLVDVVLEIVDSRAPFSCEYNSLSGAISAVRKKKS